MLHALLEKELDNGWVVKFQGSRKQPEKKWPGRREIGKLSVLLADDRDPRPRLVYTQILDSAVRKSCLQNSAGCHTAAHDFQPTGGPELGAS